MSKILIEKFDENVNVYLEVKEGCCNDLNKYIVVEFGEGEESWRYWMGSNIDCYDMIPKFLDDLDDAIDPECLGDGWEGTRRFLDSLLDNADYGEPYMHCVFMQAYE